MSKLTINSGLLDIQLAQEFKELEEIDKDKLDETLEYLLQRPKNCSKSFRSFAKNFPGRSPLLYLLFLIDEGWEISEKDRNFLERTYKNFPTFLLDDKVENLKLGALGAARKKYFKMLYYLRTIANSETPIITYELDTLEIGADFFSNTSNNGDNNDKLFGIFIFNKLEVDGGLTIFLRHDFERINNFSNNIILDFTYCDYYEYYDYRGNPLKACLDFNDVFFKGLHGKIKEIILPENKITGNIILKNIKSLAPNCKISCKGNLDHLVCEDKEDLKRINK